MVAFLVKPRTWVVPTVLLWFGVGLMPFQPTDLDIFFWSSVRQAVGGQPLQIYSSWGLALYPNANGPVSLLPLSLLGYLLNAFGQFDATELRRGAPMGLFSIFILLMAREAIAAVERLRGGPLQPPGLKLLAYGVIVLNPVTWDAVAGYGHIEQPIEIWLLLLAVRWLHERKALPAGIAFGAAILTRSSAVLMSVTFGLATLPRGWRTLLVFFTAAAGAGIAILLPFLLADQSDVIHSLFTYRGNLPVGAGSVWSLVRGGPLEPVVQHWDTVAVVALVIATNVWLSGARGLVDEARLFAAMTATSAAFALLAKTVWPYYLFEMFVFGTIWSIGTWRMAYGVIRLVLIPLALSIYVLIAEIGAAQNLPIDEVRTEGAAMFVLLGLLLLWTMWFARRVPAAAAGMAPAAVWLKQHGPEGASESPRSG